MKSFCRLFLQVTLLSMLIACFLLQMWEQFDKFLKGQKTVAVSFEERKTQKLPTFAFCDSRAYKIKIPFAATAARYNESTYDVEKEVNLNAICESDYACVEPTNVTMRIVPSTYNGYCKLYEFHEEYKTGSYAGLLVCLCILNKIINQSILISKSFSCLWTDHSMSFCWRMVAIHHWCLNIL